MALIKRYSNRKLYDTQAGRYVTIAEIAELVKNGADIQVIDHSTGEDLTTLILLQAILEQEKRMGGLFPQIALTRLLRVGDGVVDSLWRKINGVLPDPDDFKSILHARLHHLQTLGKITSEEAERMTNMLLSDEAIGEENTPAPLTEIDDESRFASQTDLNELLAQLQKVEDALKSISPQ